MFRCLSQSRTVFLLSWFVTLVCFGVAGSAPANAQVLNQKVVRYLASNVGKRIGGGEGADAVSEALRSAGAAFTSTDLGEDYPEDGDRMWGQPIKFLSYSADNKRVLDSNPQTSVMPGDVLQYSDVKFVYETKRGRKTYTTTVTVAKHSSVISKVNSKGLLPIEVYEQNGPSTSTASTRELGTSSIDVGALRDGWILVYRPRARVNQPMKYQISVVNNTSAPRIPVVKSGLNTLMSMTLDSANTPGSYSALWATSPAVDKKLRLVLPNGAAMDLTNGAAYEIYQRSSGVVSIRLLSP